MRTEKKKKKEVRTMKSKYWYYKGSDIIGEGRKDNYRTEDKEERD